MKVAAVSDHKTVFIFRMHVFKATKPYYPP